MVFFAHADMSKLILGFTGEAGSGKDAAAQYLHTRYGAYIHTFSTPLRDLLERLYLPITRPNMSGLSTSLRALFGEELFGRVIVKDIEDRMHPVTVVTGIRRKEDMVGLSESEDFHLVYIEATPETRYARILARGQNQDDATKTYDDFLKENEFETERTIRSLRGDAQRVIENNASVEELHAALDVLMRAYGYEPG
jgi:dephospho-CoA kinase